MEIEKFENLKIPLQNCVICKNPIVYYDEPLLEKDMHCRVHTKCAYLHPELARYLLIEALEK